MAVGRLIAIVESEAISHGATWREAKVVLVVCMAFAKGAASEVGSGTFLLFFILEIDVEGGSGVKDSSEDSESFLRFAGRPERISSSASEICEPSLVVEDVSDDSLWIFEGAILALVWSFQVTAI